MNLEKNIVIKTRPKEGGKRNISNDTVNSGHWTSVEKNGIHCEELRGQQEMEHGRQAHAPFFRQSFLDRGGGRHKERMHK